MRKMSIFFPGKAQFGDNFLQIGQECLIFYAIYFRTQNFNYRNEHSSTEMQKQYLNLSPAIFPKFEDYIFENLDRCIIFILSINKNGAF